MLKNHQVNQADHQWCPDRLILAILLAVLVILTAPHAEAISIKPSMSSSPLDPGSYLLRERELPQAKYLREVLDLLAADKRDKAKLLLAQVLTFYPKDANALGLAGAILLEEKKYKAAEESFRRALNKVPGNADLLGKLGVSLLLQGKYFPGEMELRKSLAIQPDNILSLRYIAWLSQFRGDTLPAIAYFNRILDAKDFPRSSPTDVHEQLALLYNQTRRYEETIQLLNPVLDPDLKDERQQILASQLIEAYTELRQQEKAERWLARLAKQLGKDAPTINIHRAQIKRAKGQYKQALELLRNIIKHHSNYASLARYNMALVYIVKGDKKSALREYERLAEGLDTDELTSILPELVALKLDEGDQTGAIKTLQQYAQKHKKIPVIKWMLAEAQLSAGKHALALKIANEIIKNHPTFAPAYYLAGRLERAFKKTEKAEERLQKAISLNRSYQEAWVELASIKVEAGEMGEAAKILQKALAARPNDAVIMFEIASVYQESGSLELANQQYRSILKAEPAHLPSLNNLALNLVVNGKIKEAMSYAKRAYEQGKQYPNVVDTYGWVLVNAEDVKTGLKLLRSSIKAIPDDPHVNYHMGVALLKSGKKSRGRQYLKKALSLKPDDMTKAKIKSYLK